MNSLITKKFKFVLLCFLATALFACSALFAVNVENVNAQTSTSAQMYLPLDKLQTGDASLISPSDIYCDDLVTAIVVDSTKSLLIYQDGEFADKIDAISAFQVVKKLDENTLLVTDDANIHKIELNNGFNKTQLQDTSGSSLGCNYFDLNESYLVKVFSGKCVVYVKTENGFTPDVQHSFDADGNFPVAINANNEIFYVYNSNLYKRSAEDLSLPAKELIIKSSNDTPTPPSRMVADARYVYYVWGTDVYKIDHTALSPTPIKMSVNAIDKDAGFELGTLTSPKSICFRGENLVVTDGDTAQEFSIEDNTLTFTGYAIASGKSAYNRVSQNASEIEKYGDTIAVLDGEWLKVITTKNSNVYSRENYILSTKDISVESVKPDTFALGKDGALFSYAHNTSSGSLRFLKYGEQLTDAITLFSGNVIHDITYQSGCYYALADNGKDTFVYRADEQTYEFNPTPIATVLDSQYSHFAVDVYGDIYLATSTKIDVLKKVNEYQSTFTFIDSGLTAVKKLQTDLSATLFVLDGTDIKVYSQATLTQVQITAPCDNIKSFALDHVCERVFFLYQEQEFVCESYDFGCIALDSLSVPDTFNVTDKNADIDSLKVYTSKSGANVYTVVKNEQDFTFKGIEQSDEKYLYVCAVEHIGKYASVNLYALAGQDKLVLIDQSQLDDVTDQTLNKTSAPATVFVTTDVNAYYFPLITKNSEHALYDNQTIRLSKQSILNPQNTITFNEKEFYFASFTINGVTYTGYVPKAFTTPQLAEDFTWTCYTVEKVKATVLYSNTDLTDELLKLDDGQTIRVLDTGDGFYYVAVFSDGGWIGGYVNANAIKNDAGLAVRNILIILIVSACIFGSAVYFIKRKKTI